LSVLWFLSYVCACVYEHCMHVCFLPHARGVCVHMRDVGLHVCFKLNLFGVLLLQTDIKTVVLRVMMHCEGCASTVKRAVKRIPGRYIIHLYLQWEERVRGDWRFWRLLILLILGCGD
jgi:hypothetical protein